MLTQKALLQTENQRDSNVHKSHSLHSTDPNAAAIRVRGCKFIRTSGGRVAWLGDRDLFAENGSVKVNAETCTASKTR